MKPFISVSVTLNILLLVVILFMRECSPEQKPCPETKDSIRIEKTIDTISIKGDVVYKPEPYETIDTFILPVTVDTAKILAEYLKLNRYDLSVLDDSNGKVNVFVDVQLNRIKAWDFDATFYPKTTVIEKNHVYVVKPKIKVFAGIQPGMVIPDQTLVLMPSAALLTQKEHLYSIGYDPFSKTAQVGIFWKIKLKR